VQQPPFAADLPRLQAMPGVGPLVALTVRAVFSEVDRFPSAKHAASYAGLVPSTAQSGERTRHGRSTKRGSGELRALRCEAAQHARRADHPLNPYCAKLCAKRGYRMAVVAVAHRLGRILFARLRHRTELDGVAGRTVQNPTLAKRQGKEDDVVEDLSSPFLATHIVPCVPRWASDAFHGLSAWRDVSKKRHLSKRV